MDFDQVKYKNPIKLSMGRDKKLSFKHINVENLPDKIRQPYDLTKNFVKSKFTPEENRVLIRILQRIKLYQSLKYTPELNIDDRVGVRFHWKELLLPNQNAKNQLEKSLKSLREKSVEVKSNMEIDGEMVPSIRVTGVISAYEHDKERRFVDIELDEVWYSYLVDLSLGYTEFDSKTSYRLSSTYAIKFYYFCCHWFKSGGKTLTISQFRKEFSIPKNSYKTNFVSLFKNKIIIPSKEALDKEANISFNFSEIKEGRTTIGFSFKFYETGNKSIYTGFNIDRSEELFERLKIQFRLCEEDKARITGLIKKYSYTLVSSIVNTYSMDIIQYVENGGTIPNAISKSILDNLPNLSDSNKINKRK